jgi:hypothetical protein
MWRQKALFLVNVISQGAKLIPYKLTWRRTQLPIDVLSPKLDFLKVF